MFLIRVKNLFTLLNLNFRQFVRKLTNEQFIHIIGDSHVLAFQHPILKVHYLGAVTAYNLVNENSSSKGREKLFKVINSLKKTDAVLLVFGEIDVRIHIYNQYIKNKRKVPIKKLIGNVIANYSQVIKEIKEKNFRVGVYNIVPPGPQANIYNYSYYAKWQVRLEITQLMNKQLRLFCKKNGVFFIDVFDKVVNSNDIFEESFRKEEFIFDDVHLNDKVTKLVIEELQVAALI